MLRGHVYRHRLIIECERAGNPHGGRWIVQTYHDPTGMPWSDECCPHFATLRQAKDAIREEQEA